jgi:hypothetical protein
MGAMIRTISLFSFCLLSVFPAAAEAASFELQQDPDGVTVKLDGQLLTRYLIKSGNKPILWPIIGPNGEELTRGYPMREATPDERTDHPHQRSLWFTHGDVNGISFWHEGARTGEIVHREFVRVEGGDDPVIVTRNDWNGPDGKLLCTDERTFRFGADGRHVWIDMDITVTASDDPVTFGDTKEGSGGIRVAGTMKVDAKKGGRIVNSEGDTDGAAWGKQAAWCDYHGPVDGNVVGIAILNHPSSFRFPTYWHVRTYGLFSPNPFGISDFTRAAKGAGDHTLQPGESFTVNYRFLIHEGDEKQGQVAEAFARYAELEK